MKIAKINVEIEKILKNSQTIFEKTQLDAEECTKKSINQQICNQISNSVFIFDKKLKKE